MWFAATVKSIKQCPGHVWYERIVKDMDKKGPNQEEIITKGPTSLKSPLWEGKLKVNFYLNRASFWETVDCAWDGSLLNVTTYHAHYPLRTNSE